MSDVTERLRAYVADDGMWTAALSPDDVREAADEIDRLRDMLALAGEDEAGRQQVESDLQFVTEERDALQARIDGAPVAFWSDEEGPLSAEAVTDIGPCRNDVRVALVVLEPEDGK